MAGEYTQRGITAMASTAFVCFLGVISTALRFLNKFQNRGRPQKDDWCILFGLLSSFSMTILVYLQVAWAYRLNGTAGDSQKFQDFLLVNYIVENFYTTSHALIKLGIILFYLEVFGAKLWIRRCCYGTMIFMAAWWIAFMLGGILQCTPVKAAWVVAVRNRPDTTCIQLPAFFVGQRSTNLLTDLILLVMPIVAVSKLHASLAKRASLIFAFLLGGLACFACAYTLALTIPMMGRLVSFNDSRSFVWTVVELELGIVCANLPFCYTYLARAVPRPIKSRVAHTVARLENSHPTSANTPARRYRGSVVKSWDGKGANLAMNTITRHSVGSDEEILARDDGAIHVTQEFDVHFDGREWSSSSKTTT